MTLQNEYTESIKPKEIKKLRNIRNFKECMKFFKRDCELFRSSSQNIQEFMVHFLNIFGEITSLELHENLINRVDFHSSLIDYKLEPIEEYLELFWETYILKIDGIYDEIVYVLGKPITIPLIEEELESLTDEEKSRAIAAEEEIEFYRGRLIFGMGTLIHQSFMAFESACKILCSFGCLAFSIIYAKHEIIQHRDVWSILRRIGNISRDIPCQICKMREACDFNINFEALANIYTYTIKFRMMADYDDFFYDNFGTWESIEMFLKEIKQVIVNQIYIKNKCMEGQI